MHLLLSSIHLLIIHPFNLLKPLQSFLCLFFFKSVKKAKGTPEMFYFEILILKVLNINYVFWFSLIILLKC